MLLFKFIVLFNKLISDEQYGFRHMQSIMTNLLVYDMNLTSLISKGIQVDAVYLGNRLIVSTC